MRKFYLFILIIFPFSLHVNATVLLASASPNCTITSLLRVGSKGAEVQCLQEKIGVVSDGNFGHLTRNAVMYFQSSHGLSADGIVGPLSRLALNDSIADKAIYPVGCSSAIGYSSATGMKCDDSQNPSVLDSTSIITNTTKNTTNPNLVNLDKFINTVIKVNRQTGVDEKQVQFMADALRKTVEDSKIDYNKAFEEQLVNDSKIAQLKKRSSFSVFDKLFSKTFSWLGINPSVAQASVGVPFGGALLFPFFCTASGNWMLTMEPLPPSYAVLLSYTIGTQSFASYNIPLTTWLLGTYVPPGICAIYAGVTVVTINTQGTITPIVGSSPL